MPVLFDPKGGSDYIVTGSTFSAPSDWTAYGWLRRASAGGGGNIFSIGSSFLIDVYYSNSTANRLHLDRKTSGTAATFNLVDANDRITYAADKWVFVCLTQTGRSTPVIYTACPADGVALGTCTVTVSAAGSGTASTSSSDVAYLGNWSGTDWALGGDLAWFGFHNVVLTEGEITEAMRRGFTTRGLQLATELRDVSTLFDVSGNKHALTNSGASSTTALGPPVNPLWLPMAHGWVPKESGAATQEVTPGAVSVGATIPAPTLTPGPVTLTPGAVSTGATIPAPTLTPGAITATPDAVSVGATIPAPTLTEGPVTIAPDAVSVGATPQAPSLAPGPVTLTPGALSVTVSPQAPSLAPGAVTLTPSAVSVTVTPYSPASMTLGPASLAPGFVSTSVTLPAPTLTPGAVTIAPDAATVSVTLPAPALKLNLTPDAVSVTATLHNPTLTPGPASLLPDVVTVSAAPQAPTLTPGAVSIAPDALAVSVTMQAPSLAPGAFTLTPGAVTSGVSLPAPVLTPGAVTITPGAVSVGVTLPAPGGLGNVQITAEPGAVSVAATPQAPSQVVAKRRPDLLISQDRRLEATVRLRAAGGYWTEVGKGVARGIVVEGLSLSTDRSGPTTCSFTLRRDPSFGWPDLEAFNECEVELGGVLVWSGRLKEAPGQSGSTDTIAFSGQGWQYHLDDDVASYGYVHTDLSQWQDMRTVPGGSITALSGDLTVQNDGGSIMLGWPSDTYYYATEGVGIQIDLGENHPGAYRFEADVSMTNPNAFVTLYGRGSTNGKGSYGGAVSGDYFTQTGSGITTYDGGTSYSTLGGDRGAAGGTAQSYRYVKLFLYCVSGPGTTGATGGHFVHVHAVRLYSAASYDDGSYASALTATDVVTDVLGKGSLPLLNTSTDDIESTSFIIPSLWPEANVTPRHMLDAVNAFHDYSVGVSADKRLYFKARDEVPVLEAGDWAGGDFSDASASSGDDIYNKVVAEAEGPDGGQLRSIKYSADALPDRAIISDMGTPSNPSFESNTTGWTAAVGAISRVSGTGVPYVGTYAASVQTPASGYTCEVYSALTGLTAGNIYTLRIAHKKWATTTASDPIFEWYAQIDDGSGNVQVRIESSEQGSDYIVDFLTFVATGDTHYVNTGAESSETSPGAAHCFYIDGVNLYRAEVNAVDRHNFIRAGRLPVGAAMTQAALDQVAEVWLRAHVTTPLKGSLTVTGEGGVRESMGGAAVHPGHLLGYSGRAILLSNLEDPDTGGWGRVGQVASVSYDHDSSRSILEIDNERHRLDNVLARYSALAQQVR